MRVALGTAQFGLPYGIANRGGQVTRFEAKAMLSLARARGIDTLDTAIAYGDSEVCLGEAGTEGFRVVTKLPAVPDDCKDVAGWVHGQILASLERLGVPSLYGVLLHRPTQLLGREGDLLFRSLQSLKDRGQAQKIGVSIYAPRELEELTSRYRFDLVQAPFSVIDRRLQTTGWLRRLSHDGVEVHTRSVFLQGVLLMPESARPETFSAWSVLWHHWHEWLTEHRISAVQACLAFPLSFPEVHRVVVGADGLEHFRQIIQAATGALPVSLPDISCEAEPLINPALWGSL
ncbi:MAG: aldo/keto reductase [Nitrospira sp.]|nr:aldo/keto reductase [Nitrospira sp.]